MHARTATRMAMLRIYRYIPAVPKVPPAPRAKSVKNAARNTTSPVTHGASGSLTATARTPADARTPTATQLIPQQAAAATAARPAPGRERAKLAEGVTTAVTTGASGHPPATAHTSATARTATKLILQAVPVAQQPAPPKRSVRRVVGNTAKKTQITMIWCSTQQKPPPVRKSAGTLTTAASAAAIPPAKSCPH